jgi:hypothetical protein
MVRSLRVLQTPFALEELQIASPCSAAWDDMQQLAPGDDRVRHCGLCDKNVYNLAGMSRGEATNLVADREGSVCIRMFRRNDGTVLTADCPVGVRAALAAAARRARREVVFAAAASLAAVAALVAFLGGPASRKACAAVDAARTGILQRVEPPPMPPPMPPSMPTMGAVAPPVPETRAIMGELPAPSPPPGRPLMGRVAPRTVR